jgi:hypothetical protein
MRPGKDSCTPLLDEPGANITLLVRAHVVQARRQRIVRSARRGREQNFATGVQTPNYGLFQHAVSDAAQRKLRTQVQVESRPPTANRE